MKALFLAMAVLLAGVAQADVKAPGTLVADQCAKVVQSDDGVTGVCFASRVGMEGRWLMLSIQSETGRYKQIALPIVEIQPGNSGITGITDSVLVILQEDDIRYVIHGRGLPYDIDSLNGELYGYSFYASGFEFVLHTM